MCKATLPYGTYLESVHIFIRPRLLYKTKQIRNTNAVSGQRPRSVPGPEKRWVAWQKVQAAMEMLDDREDRNAQQAQYICFSEDFGSSWWNVEIENMRMI